VNKQNGGQRGLPTHLRPSIDDLVAARTDYEDVEVESLGGMTLRVFGLTGVARASLMSEYAAYMPADGDDKLPDDSDTLRMLLLFQVKVVGAALGYPEDEWEAAGTALGTDAVEQLFDVASRLSGIGPEAEAKADADLKATGTDDSGTA